MKSLIFALQHLTRLPLPHVTFDEASCGRATAFFPVAGAVIGAVMAAVAWAAGLYLPINLQASLLIVLMVVLTGGIHLDGFMDSIDGLFSGRPRERKLEIMRDSRVGAFGVIGAICLLLFKFNLLAGIPGHVLVKLLVAVPAISRWNMTLAVFVFPYARQEGLGTIYKKYCGKKEMLLATVLAGAAAATALGLHGALLMALGGFITYLAGSKISKELGGLTGDIYGFINELSEVLLLLAAYMLLLK
ncbi:adenosylcobinamide-GDP ribazoletransferase [Pelotomaculum propionicicum]|uniref:adenosylcobinamide-GDP ribazoletransferase n=1 Tax=Pelotomaculum propionicicum TaxID=258475 RepID=UPI003B81D1A1